MIINGYKLGNEDKVERALHGTIGQKGALQGGVGDEASDEAKIAEYDRLGGLITKDGHRIKTGCFYDFKKKVAFKDPQVVFIFRGLRGQEIEVKDGAALPMEVQAAEQERADVATEEGGESAEDDVPAPKRNRKVRRGEKEI